MAYSLDAAVRSGSLKRVQSALAAGADVNAPDEEGGTPLSWATSAAVARLLVEAGADIEAADANRWTPLAAAAEWGYPDVVDYLLSLGANPLGSSPDEWRQGARERQAANRRCAERRADTNTTALVSAAAQGDAAAVAQMLSAGYDPNGRGEDSETALGKAVFAGHTEIVRLLLAAGADPEADAEDNDWPPLAYAINRVHADIARRLIAAGADLGRRIDGKSLLAMAAEGGSADMVRLLLDAGADPEGKTRAAWGRAAREAQLRRIRGWQQMQEHLTSLAQSKQESTEK